MRTKKIRVILPPVEGVNTHVVRLPDCQFMVDDVEITDIADVEFCERGTRLMLPGTGIVNRKLMEDILAATDYVVVHHLYERDK